MREIVAVSILLCCRATFAETISFEIDAGSSLQYWPTDGFPLDGCGESGEGPCTLNVSGTFDFESSDFHDNTTNVFMRILLDANGDVSQEVSALVVAQTAWWMSGLPFWSEGNGRLRSVGTIEVLHSNAMLSLTGFHDGRPGDGVAFDFDIHATETDFRLPGDANLDGIVDAADLNILGQHWLLEGDFGWTEGDFNNDSRVDQLDLNDIGENWQTEIRPNPVAVPEPTLYPFVPLLVVLHCVRRSM